MINSADAIKRYHDKKIGVLLGGMSSERNISLRSGENIFNALKKIGLNAVKIDVDTSISNKIDKESIDIAFLALHGKFGEDGTIQGLLELRGIPYTGPGVLGSAIGINKIITKKIMKQSGVPVPEHIVVNFNNFQSVLTKIEREIRYPFVLKPNCEGSSVGVKLVKDEQEFKALWKDYSNDYSDVFVEKYIKGKEITIGIFNNAGVPHILPVLGLSPMNEFYDFDAKYTKGKTAFELPAKISPDKEEKIKEYVKTAYQSLYLDGVVRFDAMLDQKENPYFLEVNTIPGMTDTSDIPAMAKADGIEIEELVLLILDSALNRK